MSNNAVTVFVTGKVYWCKLLGAPRTNYEGTGREWTVDFVPDDIEFLKEARLLDRLKEPKEPIPGEYLRLKKPEFTSSGEKNEPVRIYDADNKVWDNRLLGNGTVVDAKLRIVDWGKGKKKSIYLQALRVKELESYEPSEFGAMDAAKDDKQAPAKKAAKKSAPDLDDFADDDLPFDL